MGGGGGNAFKNPNKIKWRVQPYGCWAVVETKDHNVNEGWLVLQTNKSVFSLLHAEVSYIIDIASHWTFFSNFTSLSYLERQNPDFFPFSNSQFLSNSIVELTFSNAGPW